MKKWLCGTALVAVLVMFFAGLSWARGTRYTINWPKPYVGPVYVQVHDIRCNAPWQLLDKFKVWVTWGKQTKCYDIGNRGTYLLKMYKHEYCKGPMIITGNGSSFRIRYSLTPPWL
jgi:hypothetical protein